MSLVGICGWFFASVCDRRLFWSLNLLCVSSSNEKGRVGSCVARLAFSGHGGGNLAYKLDFLVPSYPSLSRRFFLGVFLLIGAVLLLKLFFGLNVPFSPGSPSMSVSGRLSVFAASCPSWDVGIAAVGLGGAWFRGGVWRLRVCGGIEDTAARARVPPIDDRDAGLSVSTPLTELST